MSIVLTKNWKPYPAGSARQWPRCEKPELRRIIRCSDPAAWYADMIGQEITVHYFVTFGCWDINGRWIHYYDLSAPVQPYFSV